jgi:hypothetical protein
MGRKARLSATPIAPTDRPYPTLIEYRYRTCVSGTTAKEETAVSAMSPLQLERAGEVKADARAPDAAAKKALAAAADGSTTAALAEAGPPPAAGTEEGVSRRAGAPSPFSPPRSALLVFSDSTEDDPSGTFSDRCLQLKEGEVH